jgi:hypothetical protein
MTDSNPTRFTQSERGRPQAAFRAALLIAQQTFKSLGSRCGVAATLILFLSSSSGGCGEPQTGIVSQATSPSEASHETAVQETLRNTIWWSIAEERGLDPYILYAVALVESAKVDHRLATPWPWALNRRGRPVLPSSRLEAREILSDAMAKGIRAIDVGLMQVNIRWHGHRVRSPEELLDPETNIRVGADVLADAIRSAPGDLTLGIGRYHTGWHNDTDAYHYGRRVLAVAQRIRWLI